MACRTSSGDESDGNTKSSPSFLSHHHPNHWERLWGEEAAWGGEPPPPPPLSPPKTIDIARLTRRASFSPPLLLLPLTRRKRSRPGRSPSVAPRRLPPFPHRRRCPLAGHPVAAARCPHASSSSPPPPPFCPKHETRRIRLPPWGRTMPAFRWPRRRRPPQNARTPFRLRLLSHTPPHFPHRSSTPTHPWQWGAIQPPHPPPPILCVLAVVVVVVGVGEAERIEAVGRRRVVVGAKKVMALSSRPSPCPPPPFPPPPSHDSEGEDSGRRATPARPPFVSFPRRSREARPGVVVGVDEVAAEAEADVEKNSIPVRTSSPFPPPPPPLCCRPSGPRRVGGVGPSRCTGETPTRPVRTRMTPKRIRKERRRRRGPQSEKKKSSW